MTFWRFIAGGEAVLLVLLAWALWRVLDIAAAQRRKLTDMAVTVRLYREARTDSDAQIRALLDQNERLARLLIDAKVEEISPTLLSARSAALLNEMLHAKRPS